MTRFPGTPTEEFQAVPPAAPPPRKRWSRKRKVLTSITAGGGLIVVMAVAFGGSNPPPAPGPQMPTASAPPASHPAASHAPAAFKPVTLLSESGSGTAATRSFTSDSGDYLVSWTYSGNVDTSFGTSTPSNFIINEDGGNDVQAGMFLPNAIAASGHGSAQVSQDPGRHTFNVQAIGNWTIKVTSQP